MPGEGPHRLAQPVLPLQVPKHILGAVGPVLLLQVLEEDPGGYGRRKHRGGSLSRPLTRSPPGLPVPEARVPPGAASALPLLMAFPAAQLRKPDVTVAPGNGFFRRREGRASCGDWRKRKPSRGTQRPFRGPLVDFRPEPGRRAPPLPGSLCRGGGGTRFQSPPSSPLGRKPGSVTPWFGDPAPAAADGAEGSSGKPQGQLPLGHRLAQGHSAVTVRATSYPTARGPLPVSLSICRAGTRATGRRVIVDLVRKTPWKEVTFVCSLPSSAHRGRSVHAVV